MTLAIVSWKWKSHPQYRSKFTAQHVNVLRNMVRRNLQVDHKFICITDDAAGIDPDIEVIPLWEGPQVQGVSHLQPNCYRRLRLWAADAAEIVGADRLLSLDLDTVICGDMTPLVQREEDLVIWGDTARGTPYNGSMWLLKCGSRKQVWDEFDPKQSRLLGMRNKYIGSDQAWIATCLGPNEAKWSAADGVYSFRNEISKRLDRNLPDNAKAVFFHGKFDPWQSGVMSEYHWIKRHWK